MTEPVLRLYPPPHEELPLNGLYLTHGLHRLGAPDRPLIYSNFITSLDGRIALPRPGAETAQVPPAIANARDWRLYQELAAQADVLITTARFFRQAAVGQAQDHLPVGPGEAFSDLMAWRREQGLAPQPDLAVVSASLDMPLEALAAYPERRIHVLTGAAADPDRRAALRAAGAGVISAGEGTQVTGAGLRAALAHAGYCSAYAIGGPLLLHTLAEADVLDRLYITFAHRVLGGEAFDTFAWGPELTPALTLTQESLYYDAHAPEGAGQWLAQFVRRR